ncbi:hypothetical protein RI129_008092 [Pyrocoelia pectoralis]|uniref:PHD-type domain-containing protein n=1 Tax=Pyrocoelia pectoralis TaxID=417401 RepID=A0AAN7VAV9_9COLE
MEVEEINPLDPLSTELSTNNVDPLLTYPHIEDDNDDVEEIIQEPEIIDIIDDEPDNPPTSNGFKHDLEVVWRPGQLPDDYTESERVFYDTNFGTGQQAIQFHRLHCTACNTHLGSAPSDQSKRYIHPLLKVIICKSCFDFYGSGDFDKDDDGSELYCRWCGQGGKVLCCAQCPYVFCQRCIRVNLGMKSLQTVKASDDWLCFVCNPNQIVKQRVMSRALYDYVQNQLKWCEEQQQTQFLSLDKSLCCKPKVHGTKRKEGSGTYSPYDSENRKRKKLRVNPVSPVVNDTSKSWVETHEGDEVVCTPDLIILMDAEESPQQLHSTDMAPPPVVSVEPPTEKLDGEIHFVGQAKGKTSKKSAPANKLGYVLSRKMIKTVAAKGKTNNKDERKVSLDKLQYKWYENATQMAVQANQNLSTKLSSLSNVQSAVQSLTSLAQMHNNLQETLTNTIKSLMEVRKSLRADFIDSIKKLPPMESTNDEASSPPPQSNNNDVIVVDSTPLDVETNPETTQKASPHGYIKVKSPSELLASSVITISDDVATQEEPPAAPKTPDKPAPESNQIEDLSEIAESLNPETITQIKRALLESKFEKILNENLSLNAKVPPDELKKMASVRVVLSPAPQPSQQNDELQPVAAVEEEEDIENILSASTLLNPAKQFHIANSVADFDDENENDPLALDCDLVNNDSSISNGAKDANVNNELTNTSESIAVI